MFSTLWKNLYSFVSLLNLLHAEALSLEGSKISHLEKG